MAVIFALAVIVVGMLLPPLQSYTGAAERVDVLEARRDALRERVLQLAVQRARLHDPDEVEILARERLGLIKPGEIPYVVAGTGEEDRIRPDGREPPASRPARWYERLARNLRRLLQR